MGPASDMTPQALGILIALVLIGIGAALFHISRIRKLDLANQPGERAPAKAPETSRFCAG